MAAPETQFQTPGITYSTYQPVDLRLNPPIQLPETGALWANVGKTAMDAASKAGEALQRSPLNPLVKEGMNYGIDQYKQSEAQNAWLNSLPGGLGHLLRQTTPGGSTTLAPGQITDPTMVTAFLRAMGIGPQVPKTDGSDGSDTDTTKKEPPPPTTKESGKPPTTQESGKPPAPPTAQVASPSNIAQVGLVPSKGGSTAALTAGGDGTLNTGQPQSSDIEAVPAAQYRAQQQGGSVWNPLAPSPQAPPAPTAPDQTTPTQPPTPGTVPGSLSDRYAQAQHAAARQQSLTNWQNQTQTAPLTPKEALDWFQSNVSTKGKHATYLPTGGPPDPVTGQKEPAFAIDMDKGGTNVIPLSQMVNKGAAPAIAAQNTSAVLSASDQHMGLGAGQGQLLQQQQQNALAAPPTAQGQPPAATPPYVPSQGALAAAQQQANQFAATGGPPPAPVPVPSQGALGAAQAQAAQYAATGGPPPAATPVPSQGALGAAQAQADQYAATGGPPPAAPSSQIDQGALLTTPAYNAAAVRAQLQPSTAVQSQGGPPPESLMAQTASAGQAVPQTPQQRDQAVQQQQDNATPPTQAQQDAIAAAYQKNKGQLQRDKATGDVSIPSNDGFTWKMDTDPDSRYKGKIYAVLPPLASDSLYNERRFYLGDKGGFSSYHMKDDTMRQKMQYWIDRGIKTPEQVQKMTAEDMEPYLKQEWYDLTMKPGPTSNDDELTNWETFHNNNQEVKNIMQTLIAHKVDFSALGKGKAGLLGIGEAWGGQEGIPSKIMQALMQENPDSANTIIDLEKAVDKQQKFVTAHPELGMTPGKSEDIQTQSFPIWYKGGMIQVPKLGFQGQDLFSGVFSGRNPKDIYQDWDNYQRAGDFRYQNKIGEIQTRWERTDPRHEGNILNIAEAQKKGKEPFLDAPANQLQNPRNHYADHALYGQNNPAQITGYTPQQRTNQAKALHLKKGDYFMNPAGQLRQMTEDYD